MIKKLFTGQINSITLAAAMVAVSSLFSRLLGIFRDRVLAGQFGAGETLDIYYAAFRIPDLMFNLIILGALSAGFIPIFSQLIKDNSCQLKNIFGETANKEAWTLANNLLNILILSLIVLSVFIALFAPQLVKLIAPGFSPEAQAQTKTLTMIMLLSPLLLGISGIFGGILQSFKRFFVYSLSPIMYNVGIIIGAIYLVPIIGLVGLAWGVVLGAFLHLLVQFIPCLFLGWRYQITLNLKDLNLRKIGFMMIPRSLSLATGQINLLIITIIASTLASGSLAVFNLANNLQSFPIGIFGISYAVAAFPALAACAFNKKKLIENFSLTFRQIMFFIIPATVFLIALRAQIIRVILGTGNFTWNDTLLTMEALGFFALSLFAQASLPLIIRVFYARHDSKTPFFIGLVSAIINITLALWLSKKFGLGGLVLAFSLSNIFYFILMWLALKKELGSLDEKKIMISVSKFIIAAIVAGTVIQGVKNLITPFLNMNKLWGIFSQGLTAGLLGIATYLAFCSLLKSEEFEGFWQALKRRWPRKKIQPDDQSEARGI